MSADEPADDAADAFDAPPADAALDGPRPLADYTGFQRDLLAALSALDAPHGLAIREFLLPYYDKPIFPGRLYPNLDELADRGLVEKCEQEVDNRTNTYRLTAEGEAAVHAHGTFVWCAVAADADDDQAPAVLPGAGSDGGES